MRRKAYLVSTCLLIGALLVACASDGTDLPRGARRALNEFFVSEQYSVVSAQKAAHTAGGGEVWCVAVDTEAGVVRQVHLWENGDIVGDFYFLWPYDVMLVVRLGNEWRADPWHRYVSHSGDNYDSVVELLPAFLTSLGCDSFTTESVLAENAHPFEAPSVRMDNPFGLFGPTGTLLSG